MFSFLISFKPPAQQLTNEWKTYFIKCILPKFKGRYKWSPKKSGGGYLKGKDHQLVCEVMQTYGWKMGVTSWGSLRFDPVQQEPPHQEPAEGGSGSSIGAALGEVKKDGKRRSKELSR
jgi:hypothetical protein